MPTNDFLDFPRHFLPPQLFAVLRKTDFFNTHAILQQRTERSGSHTPPSAHIKQSHSIYALSRSRVSELLTYFMNDFLPNLVFKEFWTHRWQFGMQPSRVTIPLLRWE